MSALLTPQQVHKMPSTSSFGTGMGDEEDITFDSTTDEAAYYRDKYRNAADLLEETRAELDEFQASSKELEDELERELAATEKQQAELKERIKRLEEEKEEWKSKHVALQKMHSSTTSAMQREMDNLRSERDKTLVALRDLEVGNDELERNERVAVSSLLDLESKYNRAIEEKTLLEQEVIIRGELEEQVQRLKTELRDSADQISILRDQLARNTLPTPPSSISAPLSPSLSSHNLADADYSTATVEPSHSPRSSVIDSPLPPAVPPKQSIPLSRSVTSSNIPSLSPASKRFSSHIPSSPAGVLARSTTSRNLSSPSMKRAATGLGRPQSPAPARSTSQPVRNKGFKLLYELQARLKATDDKLGTRAPRRNVSGGPGGSQGVLGPARRVAATQKVGTGAATHSRVAQLSQKPADALTTTPMTGTGTGTGMFSPWVLTDEITPVGNHLMKRSDPESPLEAIRPSYRAPSGASSRRSGKELPQRPTIPSPLMNMAAQSASLRAREKERQEKQEERPPVSSGLARSMMLGEGTGGVDLAGASASASATSTRPPSRLALGNSTRTPSRTSQVSHNRVPSRSGTGPSSSRPEAVSTPSGIRPPSRTALSRPASRMDGTGTRDRERERDRERPTSPPTSYQPKSPTSYYPSLGSSISASASASASGASAVHTRPLSRATEKARERRVSQTHTRAHSAAVPSNVNLGSSVMGIGRGPPPVYSSSAFVSRSNTGGGEAVSGIPGLSSSTSSPGLALRRSVRGPVGLGQHGQHGQHGQGIGNGSGNGNGQSRYREGQEGDELGGGGDGGVERTADDVPNLRRSLARTPSGKGRPLSMPHFGTPPSDVPKIPSMHLKKDRSGGGGGVGGGVEGDRDRDRERERERRRVVTQE